MPYSIQRRDGQYCVIKDSDGKTMGCHDTQDDARAQIAAIEANEGRKAVTVKQGADGARYMTLVTTNGYKDRENEYITTQALTDWVNKQWDGDTFKSDNKLDFWHMPSPTIGTLEWADMQGTFLVEVYKERVSGLPLVQHFTRAIWDYVQKQDDYGASHLFVYSPEQVEDTEDGRVYHAIDKQRSTTLPLEYAANPYTFSGVLNMTNTQKQERDNVIAQAVPGFGDFLQKLRGSLSGAQDNLDKSGVQFKSIGESVTKEDLADILVVATKEATKQVLETVQKDEDQETDVDFRAIVEEVIASFMAVPATNVADYEDTLAVEDDADAADETEPAPAVDDETKELLVKAITAYDSVTEDNAALLEAFQTLGEQFKSFGGVPDALRQVAGRVDALEKQLAGRSKRATRSPETLVEGLSPELKKQVDDTLEATQEEVKTFFDLPGSGREPVHDNHD